MIIISPIKQMAIQLRAPQEGVNTRLCLYSAGDSTPTLAPYDFSTDNSKWNLRNK